jgi:hypothetical protein
MGRGQRYSFGIVLCTSYLPDKSMEGGTRWDSWVSVPKSIGEGRLQ